MKNLKPFLYVFLISLSFVYCAKQINTLSPAYQPCGTNVIDGSTEYEAYVWIQSRLDADDSCCHLESVHGRIARPNSSSLNLEPVRLCVEPMDNLGSPKIVSLPANNFIISWAPEISTASSDVHIADLKYRFLNSDMHTSGVINNVLEDHWSIRHESYDMKYFQRSQTIVAVPIHNTTLDDPGLGIQVINSSAGGTDPGAFFVERNFYVTNPQIAIGENEYAIAYINNNKNIRIVFMSRTHRVIRGVHLTPVRDSREMKKVDIIYEPESNAYLVVYLDNSSILHAKMINSGGTIIEDEITFPEPVDKIINSLEPLYLEQKSAGSGSDFTLVFHTYRPPLGDLFNAHTNLSLQNLSWNSSEGLQIGSMRQLCEVDEDKVRESADLFVSNGNFILLYGESTVARDGSSAYQDEDTYIIHRKVLE